MGSVGLTNVGEGYGHIRTDKEWFIALKAACASFTMVCQRKPSPKDSKDRKDKAADWRALSFNKSTNCVFHKGSFFSTNCKFTTSEGFTTS